MSISQYQIQEFMSFFTGHQKNYREFIYEKENGNGEKRQGKAQTVKNKLDTIENYKDHLLGKKGLGIIPINERRMIIRIISSYINV